MYGVQQGGGGLDKVAQILDCCVSTRFAIVFYIEILSLSNLKAI